MPERDRRPSRRFGPGHIRGAVLRVDDIASRLAARMARSNLMTQREHQVLQLVAKGLTNKEIGRAIAISDNTARNYVNSSIEKLEVSDRTEAATIAMRQGLVSLD
jgi:two-component system NarL family response regulator